MVIIILLIVFLIRLLFLKLQANLEKMEKEIKETVILKVRAAVYESGFIVVKLEDKEGKYEFLERYAINKVKIVHPYPDYNQRCLIKNFNYCGKLLEVTLVYDANLFYHKKTDKTKIMDVLDVKLID